MRKIILIIALLAFPLVCFGQDAATKATPKHQEGASKEQIIGAAKSEAEELGLNLEEMVVFYDEGNQRFDEYLKHKDASENNIEKDFPMGTMTAEKSAGGIYQWLSGINYQAVYLANRDLKKSGGLWFFVDRDTGRVITYTREGPLIDFKIEKEQPQEYYINE